MRSLILPSRELIPGYGDWPLSSWSLLVCSANSLCSLLVIIERAQLHRYSTELLHLIARRSKQRFLIVNVLVHFIWRRRFSLAWTAHLEKQCFLTRKLNRHVTQPSWRQYQFFLSGLGNKMINLCINCQDVKYITSLDMGTLITMIHQKESVTSSRKLLYITYNGCCS